MMLMKNGQELLYEINTCKLEQNQLAFWWLGQLGFAVKLGSTVIYLDAYLTDRPGRNIPPLMKPSAVTNADFIVGSHDHSDHIDAEVWHELSVSSPQARFVAPKCLVPSLVKDAQIPLERFVGMDDGLSIQLSESLRITGIAAAHEWLDQDPQTGEYPYLGYVIQGNGCMIYHSGDTCIYEGLYGKLRAFGRMDIMFLPINGRDGRRFAGNTIGNMTYQEAVDLVGTLKPRLAVPAHYEMFDSNSEDPNLFISYLTAKYPDVSYWVGEHGEKVICG